MPRTILKKARRVVVKIGSRVLTLENNGLDRDFMKQLAAQIARLKGEGREVIIVSSGAVAAGRNDLGIEGKPRTIPQKQAAAAIGQSRLMRAYEEAFSTFGHTVAQILLTRDDLSDRLRFLNARSTIETLLACGVIPIINENDTVAVDEIKFGDNDNLSALVTNLTEAELLVILTDIDGFFDADPRTNKDARLISLVESITRKVEHAAGGSASTVGTGGMVTKLAAAKKAGKFGVPTLMVNGKSPGIVARAMAGEEVGTLFLAAKESLPSRKHWIAYTLHPKGRLVVDEGACTVLSQHGRSLLPSGVVSVEGEFDRGDCVKVCGPDGAEFARGIVAYSHKEIASVMGRRSSEIEAVLGYKYGDEVIHRDNLVLLS
ncbi:MAG TPA: glutamate 5-kinase [Geobacteraceae bacterium]